MEQGLGSESNDSNGSIDRSRVLDVKPLRSLAPIFPTSSTGSSATSPNLTPFACVPPHGPFPAGVQPFFPFLSPNNGTHQTPPSVQPTPPVQPTDFGFIPDPVPLNSFRTPTPKANGGTSQRKKTGRPRKVVVDDDDEYSEYGSGPDGDGASKSRKRRSAAKRSENGKVYDIDSLVDSYLTSFKLMDFEEFKRTNSEKDIVSTILLVFYLLRRQLTQLEEANDLAIARRPDLKAGALLMTKGVRANHPKKMGHLPGIEVGEIFFFRMELCIVGIHCPSMAGIDYLTKHSTDEDPMAISIVSSGGYDDDDDNGDNTDVLIYTGQGGGMKDGQMSDQKLERGNLALEKSLHRGNEIRVIRGLRDASYPTGKIYVYDGLYKIHESWAEKNKNGCNVFRYKFVRQPGQPVALSLWKSIQRWKDGTAIQPGVILPDLTSGAEIQPVTLVNDVDAEKGPAHFTYVSSLKNAKPFSMSESSPGCHCLGGCQPGDTNCPCNQKNDGFIPYSSIGVLLSGKSLIHECGQTCACPPNCRSRMTQGGVKVHLEVFKTKNRGWGLRSWDPIRAGVFICEYAGDVVKELTADDYGNRNDDNYIFDATRYYEPLETVHDDSAGFEKAHFPLFISAKHNGNVARFMNHSCSPNVIWQPVLRESNNGTYMHVAFFAIQHIPPMQELTYDYGVVPSDKGGAKWKKKCFCGSVKCRGYFF